MAFFQVVMLFHCIKAVTLLCAVVLTESLLEQHINGRRHQFMLAQLRQRLRARKSIFVRGFLFTTTASELSNVFECFGSIEKVILNQTKVASS